MMDGIEKLQLHRWKNAIPKEGSYLEQDRVKSDLKVLHEIKTLNLEYTRQHLVTESELMDKVTLRHLVYRFMTGIP